MEESSKSSPFPSKKVLLGLASSGSLIGFPSLSSQPSSSYVIRHGPHLSAALKQAILLEQLMSTLRTQMETDTSSSRASRSWSSRQNASWCC